MSWLREVRERRVARHRRRLSAHNSGRDTVLNLTATSSADIRWHSVDLGGEPPDQLKGYLRPEQSTLGHFGGSPDPFGPFTDCEYRLPRRHDITRVDLSDRAIGQLEYAYERQVDTYGALVETEGSGRGSLRALALIAELLYDAGGYLSYPGEHTTSYLSPHGLVAGMVDHRLEVWCAGEEWCPVTTTMSLIGKKWHPVIIHRLLQHDALGFNELKREVDGISSKVLSDSLDDLEENGFVDRTVVSDKPVRVEYSLTELGRSLEPVIMAMRDWGSEHLKPPATS